MPVKHPHKMETLYALSIAWQLGFLICVSIGGFLFLGFWLDSLWHTAPLFLFVGLFLGFVITVFAVYHMLIPLIKRKT